MNKFLIAMTTAEERAFYRFFSDGQIVRRTEGIIDVRPKYRIEEDKYSVDRTFENEISL
jgi:hypothetical protein